MSRHNQIVNGGSSSAIEHVHRIVHFAVVPIATGRNHAPVAGGVVRGTILEHVYRSLDFPLSHYVAVRGRHKGPFVFTTQSITRRTK
jgi:hypothetical protein